MLLEEGLRIKSDNKNPETEQKKKKNLIDTAKQKNMGIQANFAPGNMTTILKKSKYN